MDYFKRKLEVLEKIKKIKSNRVKLKENKKDINFINCKSCKLNIKEIEFSKNLMVCPNCGHHGKIGLKDRIENLLDSYSIIQFDQENPNPLKLKNYYDKREELRKKSFTDEAVLVCKGLIKDNPCYLFAMDNSFFMGSMGIEVGKRIVKCFDMAREEGLAVIGICSSGGARMQEGIFSLMQMGNTVFAVREHSDEKNLYISILTDPTTGGVSASFANLADIIIAEPKARICFTGRRVIEQTIHEKLPEEFQTSEFLLEHGFLDDIVPRKAQKDYIAKLLEYHR